MDWMKTIGLIGGMSWESTAEYYRILNTLIKQRLGGLHSAKLLLYSVDFAEIERLQRQGEWEQAGTQLEGIAKILESAGADVILLGTNTMHKVAGKIIDSISVPFLHICDSVSQEIVPKKLDAVGLLGTRYTMEQAFYRDKLQNNGLKVIIPEKEACAQVNRIIFEELCLGKVERKSAETMTSIVDHMIQQGARGLILGCTELSMLSKFMDLQIPVFDTTQIHCQSAVDFALA